MHTKIQACAESIGMWQRVHNQEACGLSIPRIHSYYTCQLVSPCPICVSSHEDLTRTRWLLVLYFTRCAWIPRATKSCPQFCIDEAAGKQILGIPLPSEGMLNESTLLQTLSPQSKMEWKQNENIPVAMNAHRELAYLLSYLNTSLSVLTLPVNSRPQ